MSDWEELDAEIHAAAEAMGMGSCPLGEGIVEVFSNTTGLELGLLFYAPDMGEPPWIVETSTGGTSYETLQQALTALDGNKRKYFLVVELEYAEPIDRPIYKKDMDMWDAAERFLVNDLVARRESLEPAGMKLKRIRSGTFERDV